MRTRVRRNDNCSRFKDSQGVDFELALNKNKYSSLSQGKLRPLRSFP